MDPFGRFRGIGPSLWDEDPNSKFQNPNKLQLPTPKLKKRVFYDLILSHWVIDLLDMIWLLVPACSRQGIWLLI
jgi:hypothetical protein